MKSGKLKNNL